MAVSCNETICTLRGLTITSKATLVPRALYAGVISHKVNHGHNRSPKITGHCRLAGNCHIVSAANEGKNTFTNRPDKNY